MLQPKVSSIWEQPGSVHPYAEMPHFETELEITNFVSLLAGRYNDLTLCIWALAAG